MHPEAFKPMRGSGGPILDIGKLCRVLSIPKPELEKIIALSQEERYSNASVGAAKSDGSRREVFNPCPQIRRVQSRIVRRIFKGRDVIRWHSFLYGSMPNQVNSSGVETKKDYVTCAAVHCESKSILKIDIKDFFGNVHSDTIVGIWSDVFGYSSDVSQVLTDLCMREDSLPQGGITSSYLAMLCLHDVESAVVSSLQRKGLRYSRYVDDITVSSTICDYDFDLALSKINAMLIAKSLPINERKIKRSTVSTEALTVHGLRVSFSTPRLPAEEVGRIRASVKTIEILATEPGFRQTTSFRRSYNKCMGRVNKLSRVGHNQHARLLARLKRVRPLPSRNDIKKAVMSIRKLKAEYALRGSTYGYKKRFYALIERVNLISHQHGHLAKILRGSMHGFSPKFTD